MSLYNVITKGKNIEPNSLEELESKWIMMGRNKKFWWLYEESMDKNRYTLTDEKYWEMVRESYQGSELGHLNYMNFEDIMFLLQGCWGEHEDGKKYFMSKEEQEYLKNLDDEVTIYRGVMINTDSVVGNPDHKLELDEQHIGISWSLDKDKGEWFGNRFSEMGDCYLLETKIDKQSILYYLNNMKEHEVILDPHFIKEDVKVTNLKTNEVSFEMITEC